MEHVEAGKKAGQDRKEHPARRLATTTGARTSGGQAALHQMLRLPPDHHRHRDWRTVVFWPRGTSEYGGGVGGGRHGPHAVCQLYKKSLVVVKIDCQRCDCVIDRWQSQPDHVSHIERGVSSVASSMVLVLTIALGMLMFHILIETNCSSSCCFPTLYASKQYHLKHGGIHNVFLFYSLTHPRNVALPLSITDCQSQESHSSSIRTPDFSAWACFTPSGDLVRRLC
jgi:hypothetical protein